MVNVVVVGAGVVGLTTAYELLRAGHEVTIIAKQIPTDFQFGSNYTSPFAGANWASFASKDEIDLQKIDLPGYYKFRELAKLPESGVHDKINYTYVSTKAFGKNGGVEEYPWYLNLPGINAKRYNKDEIPQGLGLQYGYSYDGVVISTTYYLTWLLNENLKTGKFTIKRKTIKSLKEAIDLHHSGSPADLIVNSTGLLARDLVEPSEASKLYAIRGITLLVENDLDNKYSVKDFNPEYPAESLYLMPRKEGGTVIGGCMEIGNDSQSTITPEQKQRLIQKVKKFFPRMLNDQGELDIVREQVGFRPGRVGGPRIELDQPWTFETGVPLIHNYGHGGTGYQASWGSADKVLRTVAEYFTFKAKL